MPFSAALSSVGYAIEMLVLSWTSHARLVRAIEPRDYEFILQRTIQEVKFHSETLLAMLFFMGTTNREPYLISWTLACLLFTLITYTALIAMSGDALHKWIDSILCGRATFACLTKAPALSVLGSLCALAHSQWNTPFTTGVLFSVVGILVLTLAVRLHV
ncbi:hypothetical protein EW145_g7234, partial [Phellinidium pouzarii]